MAELQKEIIGRMSKDDSEDWRFELRIRYLPTDLSDLYERDKTTFCCYYDQVRFQASVASKNSSQDFVHLSASTVTDAILLYEHMLTTFEA